MNVKKLGIVCLCLVSVSFHGNAQKYINLEWAALNGNVGQYDKVSSGLTIAGNLVYFGNRLNASNNNDMYLNFFHSDGVVNWEQLCTSSTTEDDFAVDMVIDDNDNIITVGAHHNGVDLNYVVSKFLTNGTLVWEYFFDGGGNDMPSSIDVDANGNIIVSGTRQTVDDGKNMQTIMLDNSGSFLWSDEYDYMSLDENVTQVLFDANNDVVIVGSSQSSTLNSDFIVRKYDGTGNVLATIHHQTAGNGLDIPKEMHLDDVNNIYIVGNALNSGLSDVKILALDDQLQVKWVTYIDEHNLDDEGASIDLDSYDNPVITGFTYKSSGGSDALTSKLSATDGSVIWKDMKTALSNGAISKGIAVRVDGDNNVYVITRIENATSDFSALSYNSDGDLQWEKVTGSYLQTEDVPQEINIRGDDIIAIGTSNNGLVEQVSAVKLSISNKPNEIEFSGGEPSHVEGEILIRFRQSALIIPNMDKVDFEFGTLDDFVKTDVIDSMVAKTGHNWHKAKTFKVFRRMTSADSVSMNRLGVEIPTPDFWTTLSVYIPDSITDELFIANELSTLTNVIQYAERDYIGKLTAAPNDALYITDQSSMYSPAHGINIEDAWDTQVGQNYVKVGVYDSGVNWRHEDYGDGTISGTKVAGGWDFYNSVSPFSQTYPDATGHGSAVSGIIGALRNNNIGIAGVAGGDMTTGNTGVQMFTLRIANGAQDYVQNSVSGPAIVEGALENFNTGYGYGLHIQNHSWGSPNPNFIIRDAVETAYLNNCILTISSGNAANIEPQYPASYNDYWVLKVGANDATGSRVSFSSYGNYLDLIAPGTEDITSSLDHDQDDEYLYVTDGTSFAAPQVAGVAALMYSEHNVVNGYPNNLAPEDVEEILQSSATDVGATGYDDENGHGRLNATSSLEKVSLPQYFIKHSGGTTSNPTQTSAQNIQISLANESNGVAQGTYFADRYQVTNTFLDIFASDQEVIGHWPRYSSSVGFNGSNPVSAETAFIYTTTLSGNVASITTTTFCYFVNTSINGQTVNTWIPSAPSGLRTAYSLHVRDNSALDMNNDENQYDMSFYPNPVTAELTIDYALLSIEDTELTITDATGRIIAIHELRDQVVGNNSLTINVSHLANGIYVCTLKLGNETITKRIVKQ